MNNFKSIFESFIASFNTKGLESFEILESLDLCFKSNSQKSLKNLYNQRVLFTKEFLELDLDSLHIPENYKLLFRIIKQNEEEISKSSEFITGYSKIQLLQGVANLFEKSNAELKYNHAWLIKNAIGNQRNLETERQSRYFSKAGIDFQELLNRFYLNASDNNKANIVFDDSIESNFNSLFRSLTNHAELIDTIERHLFFDWIIEIDEKNALKTYPPSGQKEGNVETDLINAQKTKFITEAFHKLAEGKLAKRYLETIKNNEGKPPVSQKYFPDENNKEEMDWFAESVIHDVFADLTAEAEMIMYIEKYFPGIEEIEELEINGVSQIPLKEAFRVLGFICELSKKYIKNIDRQYAEGVDYYYDLYPTSGHNHNNDYSNEDLENERKIIAGAKSKITNDNCLVCFDYEKLVKGIQWMHQYDADFIKKIIELFIYDPLAGITRAPFFKIGKNLCWFPNMVAYASFAENLIENLISKGLINIHLVQTEYFEKNLQNLFDRYGYKIILKEEDKIFKQEGKDSGDFDLLAYKNRELIYMQLKLTMARNSYKERWSWKEKKLKEAKVQIDVGVKFINNHPEEIKRILNLNEDEKVNKVNSYIISNSTLYDHEKIYGCLKVWYFEVMTAVIMIEKTFPGDPQNIQRLVSCLNEEKLFLKYRKNMHLQDVRFNYGEYSIKRKGLKPLELNQKL